MNKIVTILMILVLPFTAFTQKNYKGAELYSSQSWKYGKIEMRMRMAKGSGILSTFFTYKNGSELKGAFWEEIDIEVFGKGNAESFQSNIITNNPKVTSEEVHSPGFSMGDDYHTYTLEWTPDYVAWYIDGKQMRKTNGGQVSDLKISESFRLNIWAAQWADWVGAFDVKALPAYQYVNWIKYSAYTPGKGVNGSNFTESWTDNFDYFDTSKWSAANWTFDGNLVDFDPGNVVVKDGYLVLVISEAGKTGFSGTVPPDQGVTTLLEKKTITDTKVFPNPFTTEFTIENAEISGWTLQNAMGESVLQGYDTKVDAGPLAAGIYFLHTGNDVFKVLKK